MKKLKIMRGLPGAGKTYTLQHIIDFISAVICSADDFFMRTGEYKFNPVEIGKAHVECQIKALRAMARGAELVIIDNTNTQKWEYMLYEAMAEIFGYEVEIVIVGGHNPEDVALYAERNIHGVPFEAIQAMAERWED
jgi:predicted kinase